MPENTSRIKPKRDLLMNQPETTPEEKNPPWVKRITRKGRDKVNHYIREKAISRATTRIYLHGKRPEDYDEDILEVIVKEEEDKLKSELKDKGILALLAALGLSLWT